MKIRNYSEEDIKYIEENFLSMPTAQIAEHIRKSADGVGYVARKLGLSKQVHSKWTDDEINFLKEHYVDMTSEEMTKYINHSVAAINTQRGRLKLVRNEVWSDEEINYLKTHFESMTHAEIGNQLNRTEQAVRAKCFDLDLYKKELPWSDDEINFVRENYMEMKTKDISKYLNRTVDAVKLKAAKMGMKKYPYTCDYHYFDVIDTEEKAYWLGFLSADGWINKNEETNAGVTGIELQYGDINHLKKFNKSISGNYQITDRWRTCTLSKYKEKKNHMCMIRIFSLTIYNSLAKLGFTNEKSFDCHIPDLPEELLRHYIRGYFDGDGCFSYTNKTFSVKFITASEVLYNDILKILKSLSIDSICDTKYVNEFGTLMYNPSINRVNDKLKFLNYIYSDCNIYLDRKYNKYLQVINKYNQLDGLAC